MGLSIWQILIVVVLIILLFGRGKISDLMGDVAQGIKSFRKGLNEDEIPPNDASKTIEGNTVQGTADSMPRDTKDAQQGETLKR